MTHQCWTTLRKYSASIVYVDLLAFPLRMTYTTHFILTFCVLFLVFNNVCIQGSLDFGFVFTMSVGLNEFMSVSLTPFVVSRSWLLMGLVESPWNCSVLLLLPLALSNTWRLSYVFALYKLPVSFLLFFVHTWFKDGRNPCRLLLLIFCYCLPVFYF